jgi:hypothetical protein
MLTNVMISAKSDNKKTGPMPTISRSIEATCPRSCPLISKSLGGNGACYASTRINGTTKKFQADVTIDQAIARLKPAQRPNAVAGNPRRLIRDRVVGDVMADPASGSTAVDVDYVLSVAELAARSVDAAGRPMVAYGYTHAFDYLTPGDVATIADSGYVMNASCDDRAGIERAVMLGMPTVIASDDITEGEVIAGRRTITCPAQIKPGESAPRAASCAACGLCAKPNRAVTVRFLMH